ncbi:MAG: putative hydro-lyase [Gomphosphaeria aponina SAG 52.96 = DSM 107014]|uniref:Hydro-lyase n=1 Tax=Gomphosphaeria aponina SAG 52.96 = DSM 107014 TaxID=1521640 RepID=A0A941JSY0_9CHRO|nr:putative hydro-lyase [Gomphosphaeria aponina SAG 52.96 = DSM 107014]
MNLTPAEIRQLCRIGEFASPTAGLAPGYVQANLVILPKDLAFDFVLFCLRNPKPCPILYVTDMGKSEPGMFAPGADLRTDLPRYCVFRHGELLEELTDISTYWRDDFVCFLIGCSFTFEGAMLRAGVPVRQIEEQKNVPMYRTNIQCVSAGPFSGPLVVSMRPVSPSDAIRAVEITSRYPRVHGAPIHLGDPAPLGIQDLNRPDYGDAVTINDGEIPVFWACGVTTQAALLAARPELAITHAPGHMFVTDMKDEELGN